MLGFSAGRADRDQTARPVPEKKLLRQLGGSGRRIQFFHAIIFKERTFMLV
jgi:hypothetical protein